MIIAQMTQEYGQNTPDASAVASQNWQAMAPGIQTDVAQLALTSADTVLYQWDVENGSITFSDNISDVLPYPLSLPRHIDDWQQLIDPHDIQDWHSETKQWQTDTGKYEFRYRVNAGDSIIWIKHSAIKQNNDSILVGAITFNCMPPKNTQKQTSKTIDNTSEDSSNNEHADDLINQIKLYQKQHNGSNSQGSVIVASVISLPIIAQAFGHSAAETVMEELQTELNNKLECKNSAHRIHRDQFAIITDESSEDNIGKIITNVNSIIREYGTESSVGAVHTSSSCGYTVFDIEDPESTNIIDRAFTDLNRQPAMLYASLTQDPADQMMARQQMGLANYLSKAINENKLRLAYQPIIDAKTGDVAHYEALLRLIDSTGRVSSAGALIPIAERMGLIEIVDQKVLEMVIKELENSPNVKLAFNVSNLTSENPEWLRHIQSLLHNKPDIAERLTVEITETAAQRDLRRTAYFVAMIQDLGCSVALDDFGAGYTSFRQLKTLSVDCVKIDGEFIRDLTDNPDNRFFVKTLLEFTELFGLKSVAEFVEDGETAKMLMELGVDYMQGYYFAKPENHRSWLKDGEYEAS